MAANLIFVPGRTTNIENPILNGFRFVYNSKGSSMKDVRKEGGGGSREKGHVRT